MDFALWRTIGNQVLIKSNINNWIACKEGSGSIVRQGAGSLSCKLVKQVSTKCSGVLPKSLSVHDDDGPYLGTPSGIYYFFEGNTRSEWPIHDPCGASNANQLKDVANPHGNLFIR